MKRTIKLGSATLTISTAGLNIKNTPNFYKCNEEQLLDIREAQVREESSKKLRKPQVRTGHRSYPQKHYGEICTTKEYIRAYYRMNSNPWDYKYGSTYGSGAVEEAMDLFGLNKE